MTPGRVASADNISWERMIRAVERVRQRLLRATSALERAGIPYAVVGGHGVAAWVSTLDEAAVRNTPDVDLLIRRADLDVVKAALAPEGFLYQEVFGVDMFLDGANASQRDAVHVLFSGELVETDDLAPCPDVAEPERGAGGHQVVRLESLVRMKLTSFRLKDRVHLRDMVGVGLIDATWLARLPAELAARLGQILDNPNGRSLVCSAGADRRRYSLVS